MYCGERSLVNTGVDGIKAASLRCRAWTCPDCSVSRKKQLVAKALSGKPTTFITLTVNPAFGSSPHDRARGLVDAWRDLVRRIKAEYGYDPIPYFCVFEACESGEPHLHILARVKFIKQKWLSDQMRELTGAPIVDIRRVKNAKKLAFYISKYLGKDPHRFATCKRYWTTRDWELTTFEPKPPPGRWHDRWRIVRTPLAQLADEWRSQGYQVEQTRNRVLARSQGPPDDVLAELEYIAARRRMGKSW